MNRPWHPQPTEAARDFYARYAPTRAATMADVWSMTAGPTARFINRHGRACCAAVRAYWSALK
jgi:hypothetical protein